MSLRNAILISLLDGDASGYDLAKSFDSTVANYWAATPQQLYRELDKLAQDGLVTASVVEQERRPNKNVFTLTDEGLAAIAQFTETPAKTIAIRDELMLKVQAVDHGDVRAVLSSLDARCESAQRKIARYEQIRQRWLDGRSEQSYLATAARVGPYLTLLRGLAFEQENLAWTQRCSAAIRSRFGIR